MALATQGTRVEGKSSSWAGGVSRAHLWDLTGVGALDTIVLKFRLALHDRPGALGRLLQH